MGKCHPNIFVEDTGMLLFSTVRATLPLVSQPLQCSNKSSAVKFHHSHSVNFPSRRRPSHSKVEFILLIIYMDRQKIINYSK